MHFVVNHPPRFAGRRRSRTNKIAIAEFVVRKNRIHSADRADFNVKHIAARNFVFVAREKNLPVFATKQFAAVRAARKVPFCKPPDRAIRRGVRKHARIAEFYKIRNRPARKQKMIQAARRRRLYKIARRNKNHFAAGREVPQTFFHKKQI